MLEKLLHIFDTFLLHGSEVTCYNGGSSSGCSCRNNSDSVHGIRLGLAHLVKGLTDPDL